MSKKGANSNTNANFMNISKKLLVDFQNELSKQNFEKILEHIKNSKKEKAETRHQVFILLLNQLRETIISRSLTNKLSSFLRECGLEVFQNLESQKVKFDGGNFVLEKLWYSFSRSFIKSKQFFDGLLLTEMLIGRLKKYAKMRPKRDFLVYSINSYLNFSECFFQISESERKKNLPLWNQILQDCPKYIQALKEEESEISKAEEFGVIWENYLKRATQLISGNTTSYSKHANSSSRSLKASETKPSQKSPIQQITFLLEQGLVALQTKNEKECLNLLSNYIIQWQQFLKTNQMNLSNEIYQYDYLNMRSALEKYCKMCKTLFPSGTKPQCPYSNDLQLKLCDILQILGTLPIDNKVPLSLVSLQYQINALVVSSYITLFLKKNTKIENYKLAAEISEKANNWNAFKLVCDEIWNFAVITQDELSKVELFSLACSYFLKWSEKTGKISEAGLPKRFLALARWQRKCYQLKESLNSLVSALIYDFSGEKPSSSAYFFQIIQQLVSLELTPKNTGTSTPNEKEEEDQKESLSLFTTLSQLLKEKGLNHLHITSILEACYSCLLLNPCSISLLLSVIDLLLQQVHKNITLTARIWIEKGKLKCICNDFESAYSCFLASYKCFSKSQNTLSLNDIIWLGLSLLWLGITLDSNIKNNELINHWEEGFSILENLIPETVFFQNNKILLNHLINSLSELADFFGFLGKMNVQTKIILLNLKFTELQSTLNDSLTKKEESEQPNFSLFNHLDMYSSLALIGSEIGNPHVSSQFLDSILNSIQNVNSKNVNQLICLLVCSECNLKCALPFNWSINYSLIDSKLNSNEIGTVDFTILNGYWNLIQSSYFLREGNTLSALNHCEISVTLLHKSFCFFDTENRWSCGFLSWYFILKKFLEALCQCAEICKLRGDNIRCKYYLNQSLDICKQKNCQTLKLVSLTYLTQLAIEANEINEANDEINEIEQTLNELEDSLFKVYLKCRLCLLKEEIAFVEKDEESIIHTYFEESLLHLQVLLKELSYSPSELKFLEYFQTLIDFKLTRSLPKIKEKLVFLEDMEKMYTQKSKLLPFYFHEIFAKFKTNLFEFTNYENDFTIVSSLKNLIETCLESPYISFYYKAKSGYQLGHLYSNQLLVKQKIEKSWSLYPDKKSLKDDKLVETAKEYFKKGFHFAQHLNIPSLTQQICFELASISGRTDILMTSFYLNAFLGMTSNNNIFVKLKNQLDESSQPKEKNWLMEIQKLYSYQEQLEHNKEENENEKMEDLINKIESLQFDSKEIENMMQFFSFKVIDQIEIPWIICSLCLSSDKEYLFLTRYQSKSTPIVLRILLPEKGICEQLEERLLQINELLLPQKKVMEELDSKITSILQELEAILGCWKGLLLAPYCHKKLVKSFSRTVTKCLEWLKSKNLIGTKNSLCVDEQLLQAWVASYPSLTDSQSLECLTQILAGDKRCTQKLVSELKAHLDSVRSWEVEDLRNPLILVLDKELQNLPWDNIPILSTHAVTRMPSFSMILERILKIQSTNAPTTLLNQGLDLSNTSYIINPDEDTKLAKTEERMGKVFKKYKWKGKVGQQSVKEMIQASILQKDLFVFCGHGAGEKYFSSSAIRKLKDEVRAVLWLMGCKSGFLKKSGMFEPSGVALSYLEGGAPVVLGTLWDVFASEIDCFTQILIEEIFQVAETPNLDATNEETLLHLFVKSKSLAKKEKRASFFRNLTASSLIYYGIPIFLSCQLNQQEEIEDEEMEEDE